MNRTDRMARFFVAITCLLWWAGSPALAHDATDGTYHIHVKGKVSGPDGKGVPGLIVDYDKDNLFPGFEGKCYLAPKGKGGGWFGRTDPLASLAAGLNKTQWPGGEYEIVYPVKNTPFCVGKIPTVTVDRTKIQLFKSESK